MHCALQGRISRQVTAISTPAPALSPMRCQERPSCPKFSSPNTQAAGHCLPKLQILLLLYPRAHPEVLQGELGVVAHAAVLAITLGVEGATQRLLPCR
jgi:hypothetical protein